MYIPVVQLLSSEKGMHIRQELLEVFTSFAKRNYYCYLKKGKMEKIKRF